MAKGDFLQGFLKGLYQSGLGNPEVQRANEAAVQERNTALGSKMAEQGMVPGELPNDHPVRSKIGGLISSMFGGASTAPTLASSFRPDPTQPQFGLENTGHVMTAPPGASLPSDVKRLPPKTGQTMLASQFAATRPEPIITINPRTGQQETIGEAQKGAHFVNVPDTSRTSATEARTKYYNDMLSYKKVHDIAKATGIQPKVISTLQTNNMRADRALDRLGQDQMTWQDFNTVVTDWQGIMQGGVPHEIQYADSKFPNWKETTAKWNTFATGHPTENVPPELQEYMKGVISGLKNVDNEYLQQNADFIGKTLGSTVGGYNQPGGLGETVQGGTKKFITGGVKTSTSLSSEDQQAIEWAKANPLDPRAIKIMQMHR